MHKMSFEVNKQERVRAARRDLLWPGILLAALVMSLAWSLEPVLAKVFSH